VTTTLTPPTTTEQSPTQPERGATSARIVALVVAVVMVALLALMIWGIGRQAAGTVGSVAVARKPAPQFTLRLLDGSSFDLAATRGKPVLVHFWASWCIPCEEEAATLERASRAYRDRVVFLGVDVQDTDASAREFLRRFGVTYPNGPDPGGAISVDYGMSGVPESYFLDREGQIVRKWQGPLDDERLRAFLDELLS
jgi:cytochrome c biogenesis protein CcmG/thiol:disulfide interchange protein DsbE